MTARNPLTHSGAISYSECLLMHPQASTEALAADPFLSIMDALPAHVRLSRRVIGWRTLILLTIGVGFLGLAWWVTTQ